MADLFHNPDGANYQARAVLAYLTKYCGIAESWSQVHKRYMAEPQVDRWHNCREQGYVITLSSGADLRQINIAFFEHRNSDDICAVQWEGYYINPPTINDIPELHPYRQSKYAVTHSVSVGQAEDMADWIFLRLTDFWNAARKKSEVA